MLTIVPLLSRLRRPKVTVGIPVYNSEANIRIALESILAQTMDATEIEVICVDDGSTDATRGVIREFQARFPKGRLRLLTQENTGGPATGRNRALDEARGTYLYFLDGDDYFGPEALAAVYTLGEKQRADVVIGKYVGVGRGVPTYIFRSTREKTTLEKTSVIDTLNVLKAFRTEYARGLGYRFNPTLRMAEDHPFAMSAYLNTDTIAIQADVDCYFWVRHPSQADAAQHLTGHVLPVEEFYAYFTETLEVIESSSAPPARVRAARRHYWDRLLTFDLVTEFRRAREPDDARASLEAIRGIARRFHAADLLDDLKPRAAMMLELIDRTDADLVRRFATLKPQ